MHSSEYIFFDDIERKDRTISNESEQSVIGALLIDNNSIDKIGDLRSEHFYREDHRVIFSEILKQIALGLTADAISVYEAVNDRFKDILSYLTEIVGNTPTAKNILRHADIVVGCAVKRALVILGAEIEDLARNSPENADTLVNEVSTRIDAIAEKKVRSLPELMSETLIAHTEMIEKRMTGQIKPISTGFTDLDNRLDGGLERGTLTVVAGRPGTGKTAMGLALCRNVAVGGFAGFLSMEMDKKQIADRNIAALGGISISWLRNPIENDPGNWDRLTKAYSQAAELNLFIDDETSLTVLDIRNKARFIKRKNGLDLLVIDQLSFITGGSREKKGYEVIGEYTRGLIAIAKQLDMAIVLLCQLNRECENRANKRPQLSDLAMSGSIEQDAANVLFLYRDEIYNPDSQDKGVCEVNCAKQRQGEPGLVALAYFGAQTRFESLSRPWMPPQYNEKKQRGGFKD